MTGFHGLTAADVPAVITMEAARPNCPEHPEGANKPGFGYAGGGFGSYRICIDCGTVFGKKSS